MRTGESEAAARPLADGLVALVRYRRAAAPLMLLFGLAGEILAAWAWPYLREGATIARGDLLFLVVLLNAAHYAVGVGIGVIWARVVGIGPEAAFAGGWPAFLGLWRAALSRLGSVALLGVLLALPAVFFAAMLGHLLTLLIGPSAARGLQLPLLLIALIPPLLVAAAVLWLSVAAAADGAMPRFDRALRTVVEQWRRILPLLLAAFAVTASTELAAAALAQRPDALDPGTLGGMAVRIGGGALEMLAILVVIGGLAGLAPALGREGGDRHGGA